jgi:N-acyl-D-amino-acid deacylase
MSRGRVVFQGGVVIDGTGSQARRADVLVEGDRIVEIGSFNPPSDAQVVDVSGCVVTPGFIDMHSHSDLALLTDPAPAVKVRQGITTEVIGQDGISYAPATPEGLTASRELFAPLNGEGETLDFAWSSVGEYLDRFQDIAQNVVYLLPQGTIRFSVVGVDDREATPSEMAAMRSLVDEGMRDGAFGISTGLTYPPGVWTPTDDIVDLARVAGECGGIYVTHHRDYGEGLGEAIEEALEIGRRAEIPVHFSHFHVSGPEREGRAGEYLAPIEEARTVGMKATLDVYPYTAGCTTLSAFLPDWLKARSKRAILEELRSENGRRRVVEDLRALGPGKTAAVGWENFAVGGAAGGVADELRGKSLTEAAELRNTTVEELVCDLILESGMRTAVVVFQGYESNYRRVLADPEASIGTDGILACGVPHPRAAGTFPRVLRRAREGEFSLEQAVRMMSGVAAETLSLRDRGILRPGLAADVVVFDPETVLDTADYGNPTAAPHGIPHVMVNGRFIVFDSRITGECPGRVLRRSEAR